MSLSRRQFVRAGAVGAAGMVSSSCKRWCPWCKDPVTAAASTLQIAIKGLILVERSTQAITVHLVDSRKFNTLLQHYPYLAVPDAIIESSNAPSTVDPNDATIKLFDLGGKTLTLDTGATGSPSMAFNDDPIDENEPADDAHWKSLKYSARLTTLCGASKLASDAASKFTTNLTLEHGQLYSIKPDTQLGRKQIWEFTRPKSDGTTEKLTKQVMTNTLVCDAPVTGQKATFLIGGQSLVLKLASPAMVMLRNMPNGKGMCSGTPPCVDHMEVFYDLVDFQFKPTAKPVNIVATDPSAEPDYCPPGTVPNP